MFHGTFSDWTSRALLRAFLCLRKAVVQYKIMNITRNLKLRMENYISLWSSCGWWIVVLLGLYSTLEGGILQSKVYSLFFSSENQGGQCPKKNVVQTSVYGSECVMSDGQKKVHCIIHLEWMVYIMHICILYHFVGSSHGSWITSKFRKSCLIILGERDKSSPYV